MNYKYYKNFKIFYVIVDNTFSAKSKIVQTPHLWIYTFYILSLVSTTTADGTATTAGSATAAE
jgi:hypothetical protein